MIFKWVQFPTSRIAMFYKNRIKSCFDCLCMQISSRLHNTLTWCQSSWQRSLAVATMSRVQRAVTSFAYLAHLHTCCPQLPRCLCLSSGCSRCRISIIQMSSSIQWLNAEIKPAFLFQANTNLKSFHVWLCAAWWSSNRNGLSSTPPNGSFSHQNCHSVCHVINQRSSSDIWLMLLDIARSPGFNARFVFMNKLIGTCVVRL